MIDISITENIINDCLKTKENIIFGFANLNGILDSRFQGYNYGISIIKRLDDRIIDSIKDGPNLDYLKLYDDTNIFLSNLADRIASQLNNHGFSALGIGAVPGKVDEVEKKIFNKTLRNSISHKMVATRAGLGWIGKTALFISTKFGPRVRLTSVLLKDKVKPFFPPINKSQCGDCKLCVEACPVNAAKDILWKPEIDRDVFFDAHKCKSKIYVYYSRREIMLCGMCIPVCPIGIHNPEYVIDGKN